jgi:serine/threonine protein kinase
MEAHPAHPSAGSLRAFGLGQLDETASAALMDHLDSCAECQKEVASLSGDTFLDRLRQAHHRYMTPPPAPAPGPAAAAGQAPPASPPRRPLEGQARHAGVQGVPPELIDHPQYQIISELGRGGMGVVYLARNKLMDRLEVLKVVSKTLLGRQEAAERFQREIRSAAKLSHTNIVTAYSALQIGDLLVFGMEYVKGEDLAKVVKKNGPAPVPFACYYAQQAALGLQHAFEKGMVHRDIKPQNLILAREGKRHLVKILDFGLAKVTSEKGGDFDLTGAGKMLGTPDFIAPEQSLNAVGADIRADLYSLGCTLYYLLTGAPPFKARSLYELVEAHLALPARPLNEIRKDVPVALAEVVAKMMAKDPAKRYQRPIEVAQALAPFVKAGAQPAQPATPGVKAEVQPLSGGNLQAPASPFRETKTGSSGTRAGTDQLGAGARGQQPSAPAGVSDPGHKRARGRRIILGLLFTVLLVAGGSGGYYLWRFLSTPAPPNPALGRWGAIEIGSKGIKAIVIDVFENEDKDGYDFSRVWEDNANPTLVASAADGQAFDPKALAAAQDHVRNFFNIMREKYELPAERIYLMCSSGLFVPFAKNSEALKKNKDALAERVMAATGRPIDFASAKDEAKLAMKSCVSPKDWKSTVLIDIGSGNTKGGYFGSDDVFESMDIDFGSVTYAKRVKDEAKRSYKPFLEQAAALRPTLLEKPLHEQIENMPGLAKQKKVQLAGGVVWALATFTHPNDANDRVALTAADIDRFAVLIQMPEKELRIQVLPQVKDPEQYKKIDREIQDVQNKFTPENLQAGAEILKALSQEYKFADKQLSFFRRSHYAWALGFILEKNNIRK